MNNNQQLLSEQLAAHYVAMYEIVDAIRAARTRAMRIGARALALDNELDKALWLIESIWPAMYDAIDQAVALERDFTPNLRPEYLAVRAQIKEEINRLCMTFSGGTLTSRYPSDLHDARLNRRAV